MHRQKDEDWPNHHRDGRSLFGCGLRRSLHHNRRPMAGVSANVTVPVLATDQVAFAMPLIGGKDLFASPMLPNHGDAADRPNRHPNCFRNLATVLPGR